LRVLNDPQRLPVDAGGRESGLAFGLGRSYGDACLNPGGVLWQTSGLDRFIRFDPDSGRLVCEAGVRLRDIQRMAIPRGWMLAATPGTQEVTVGGAIANDVHGKNHHMVGSFGDHVRRLTLMRTDGSRIECGPDLERGWFAATVGGIGLTGVIIAAELQLQPAKGPWLQSETIPFSDLDAFFGLADSSETGWEYTVAWIDCLSRRGRGLFMRANPALGGPAAPVRAHVHTMPFVPPVSLINGLSLPLLNSGYYRAKAGSSGSRLEHYETFFYPLDNIRHWNRAYGPRGFYQYQSVVPRAVGSDAMKAMLAEISRSGAGSFLAVLKTFGEREALGMLSFPQPGVTLALDFPNRGDVTHKLFEWLDAIVREAGGRLYLAKDARMPRDLFESGYPQLQDFLGYRDPGISSAMSRRLMGS
jgi:FAD/FMN-containing dehydrogenase